MTMLLWMAAQAAVLPDISLHATIDARSVTIEQRGNARLEVTATPDAGSQAKVVAPGAHGRKTTRNARIDIAAEARIGNGSIPAATPDGPPR